MIHVKVNMYMCIIFISAREQFLIDKSVRPSRYMMPT